MKQFLNLILGDLDEKRKYKGMMHQVAQMPEVYRHAFHKIQNYIYCVGSCANDSTIFYDLLELFETSIANQRPIEDVIGQDVTLFCDEFMATYASDFNNKRIRLNREIQERFHKEEF